MDEFGHAVRDDAMEALGAIADEVGDMKWVTRRRLCVRLIMLAQ